MWKLVKHLLLMTLAIALCCAFVGSAFAVYKVGDPSVNVSITAVSLTPDSIGIRGSWDSWTDSVSMTLTAGTYSLTRDMAAGTSFKGYNITTSSYFNGNNHTIGKTGNYTITYPSSGSQAMSDISVSANSFTYTINMTSCPDWVFGDGAVIMIWAWYGDAQGSSWHEVDSLSDKIATITLNPIYTSIIVVRLNPAYQSDSEANRWNYKWNQSGTVDISNTTSLNVSIS